MGKSTMFHGKINHVSWENHHFSWENQPCFLGKSTIFHGKINHFSWENHHFNGHFPSLTPETNRRLGVWVAGGSTEDQATNAAEAIDSHTSEKKRLGFSEHAGKKCI